MHVAAGAIDHRAGDAAAVSHGGEDVAPDRGVFAAAVIEDNDGVRFEVVDVIAHRAGRRGGRPIQDRESAAREPETMIEGLDAETLACDAEAVEGVTDRGGVELRSPLNIRVHYFLSIVS